MKKTFIGLAIVLGLGFLGYTGYDTFQLYYGTPKNTSNDVLGTNLNIADQDLIGQKEARVNLGTVSGTGTTTAYLNVPQSADTIQLWFDIRSENPNSPLAGEIAVSNSTACSSSETSWYPLPNPSAATTTLNVAIASTSLNWLSPFAGYWGGALPPITPVTFSCLRLKMYNNSTTDDSTYWVKARIRSLN